MPKRKEQGNRYRWLRYGVCLVVMGVCLVIYDFNQPSEEQHSGAVTLKHPTMETTVPVSHHDTVLEEVDDDDDDVTAVEQDDHDDTVDEHDDDDTEDLLVKVPHHWTKAATAAAAAAQQSCEETCQMPAEEVFFQGDDLLDPNVMLRRFSEKRDNFIQKLKRDYGPENYQNMFLEGQTSSRGRTIFAVANEGGPSWERFKRKLKIKILTAQVNILHQRESQQTCQCKSSRYFLRKLSQDMDFWKVSDPITTTTKAGTYSRFVWANGGHSSSAGHGNFYWESYTAILAKTVQPIFQSIGIQFDARNYAMGGTSSGEEVALCMESIFGKDVDVLNWDYGMTDGNDFWKIMLYFYHAAQLPHHPAMLGFTGKSGKRIKVLQELENLGATAFYQDEDVVKIINEAIPDTLGLSEEQIQQMPPLVQNFKCGDQIELGDPDCRTKKYNMTVCPARKYFAKWHPGWKAHALNGNLMALFLLEVTMDALKEMASVEESSKPPQSQLHKLMAEEENDMIHILNSDLPDFFVEHAGTTFQHVFKDLNGLFKGRSFCHTALLPAEIRYLGLLTQSDKKGFLNFDEGIEYRGAQNRLNDEEMILSFDRGLRSHCHAASEQMNDDYMTFMDHKDFFFQTNEHGWMHMNLPNDDEVDHYHIDSSQLTGIIFICLTVCDWDKCPEADIRLVDSDKWKLQMKVNNKPVVEFTPLGKCHALKGDENGYIWEPNESDGKFLIQSKVNSGDSPAYVRIGSFIVV